MKRRIITKTYRPSASDWATVVTWVILLIVLRINDKVEGPWISLTACLCAALGASFYHMWASWRLGFDISKVMPRGGRGLQVHHITLDSEEAELHEAGVPLHEIERIVENRELFGKLKEKDAASRRKQQQQPEEK